MLRDKCHHCHQVIPRDRNRYELAGKLFCSWRCIIKFREGQLGMGDKVVAQ